MRAFPAVGLVVVLAAAGAAATESGVTVDITDRLEPATVTVQAGATVRWRNADDERHRVRSTTGPEKFDSGNLEPTETWSETFSVPGEYRYVDARNPDEQAYWGSVTVTGQTSGGGASSQDGTPAPDGSESAGSDAGGGAGPISMGDRSFSPASVTVAVGATVTWVNDSDRDHTATADDGSFDSGELGPGARFTHTFAQPGSYGYFCAFHGGMRGTVVVGDAESDEDVAGDSASAGTDSGSSGQPTTSSSADEAVAQPPAIGEAAGDVEVEVRDFAFDPESVEVAAGSVVTWRHVGEAPHTVTADDGTFDSGMMDSGETYSHTLTDPGTYRYVCELHPQMIAELKVGKADDPEVAGPVAAPPARDEPPASTGTGGRQSPTVEPDQAVAASPARGAGAALPAAGFLAAGLLVAASVLWGAWRIERALRGIAIPDALPAARRRPRRT